MGKQTSCELPAVGTIIVVKGDHPWSGSIARVVEHRMLNLVDPKPWAKCVMQSDDAMDGHEFFVAANQWKKAVPA